MLLCYKALVLVILTTIARPCQCAFTIIEGTGCYEEAVRGSVFTAVPLADNDVITVAKCINACPTLNKNFTHVGLTSGKTCLCGILPPSGHELFLFLLNNASSCNLKCSDGKNCGGPLGVNIYKAVSSTPKDINFQLVLNNASNVLTVHGIDTGGVLGLVYIQVGMDGPSTLISATPASAYVDQVFNVAGYPPGDIVVVVTLSDPNGVITVSSTQTIKTLVPQNYAMSVSCPPIVRPALEFACSFATAGQRGSVTFDYFDITAPTPTLQSAYVNTMAATYSYFGLTPPQVGAPNVKISTSNLNDIIIISSKAAYSVKVIAVEWYGASQAVGSKALKLQVYDASCSFNLGSFVFNPVSGFCESAQGYTLSVNDLLTSEFSCGATPDPMNTLLGKCALGTACNENCNSLPLRPDTYTKNGAAVSPVVTTAGMYQYVDLLAANMEITMLPGQYLGISGIPIHFMDESDTSLCDLDVILGATSKMYYFRAITIKPDYQGVAYTCVTSNTHIAAKISDSTSNTTMNFTQCQEPLANFSATLNTTVTFQRPEWWPATYVRSGELVNLIATNVKGHPVVYNVSWGSSAAANVSFNDTTNGRSWTTSATIIIDGYYPVFIRAGNLHSDPFFGANKMDSNLTLDLYVQYAVQNWVVVALPQWIITNGSYNFGWSYLKTANMPSNVSMNCSWGDGLLNLKMPFPLTNPLNTTVYIYNATHLYTAAGIYYQECTMYNMVSNQTLTNNVTIYEQIVDFQSYLKFVPRGKAAIADAVEAFGKDKNLLPIDRNVSFYFSYKSGTFEQIIIRNVTNGVNKILSTFKVPDIFNLKTFQITLPFVDEGWRNISVEASNLLQTYPPVVLNFQMVGQVMGILVDDYNEITSKGQIKFFNILFQSLGKGACIFINFKDGIQETYGDQYYCSIWKATAKYVPGYEITNPFILNHTYNAFGIFNVTASASNAVTYADTTDDLMVIVTDKPCQPPKVGIPNNATVNLAPKRFLRSDTVSIQTTATLNCSGVLDTRKIWEIWRAVINITTGVETLTLVPIDKVAPSTKNLAELVIPPRTLVYGVYKLCYVIRMWDSNVADPMFTKILPFERDVFTYIEITASPLVAGLIGGKANLVTRGKGQSLDLDPYLYTFDPDYPEQKFTGIEFRYYCRQMTSTLLGEPFILGTDKNISYTNLQVIPATRLNGTLGGCFGLGPGPLNANSGTLSLASKSFVADEVLYEVVLEARKFTQSNVNFTRVSTARLQVKIIAGIPPIMEILCADPALCITDPLGKIYINPSVRLALKASCSLDSGSDCSDPMTYQWSVSLPGQNPLTGVDSFFPTGMSSIEMAISVAFFETYSAQSVLYFGLKAVNGQNSTGNTMLFLNINKSPISGSCTVTPTRGTAMIDKFGVMCKGWMDPENVGIQYYTISSRTATNVTASLAKVTMFDANVPKYLSLGAGIFNIDVVIFDMWGAKTAYTIPTTVTVDSPSMDQFNAFMSGSSIDTLVGTGDRSSLMMVLQAQSAILADGGDFTPTPSPLVPAPVQTAEEAASSLAIAKGQMKIDAIALIIKMGGGNVSDLPSADAISATVQSILGEPPANGEKPNIGLEIIKSTTNVIQELVNSITGIDSIPDPSALTNSVKSITTAIGTILGAITSTTSVSKSPGDNATNVCSSLTPIDVDSANKPGVVDYDTDIGNDVEMDIPVDPASQRCKGIVDAAKLTSSSIGPQLTGMLNDLTRTLLAKSVVNEENLIETPSINLYAKISQGSALSQKQMLGSDPDSPYIKFPSKFCLGRLINDSCPVPAGLSAVVYKVNPLCGVATCDRLVDDTLTIDLNMYSRDNMKVVVQQVSDGNITEGIILNIPRTNISGTGFEDPDYYNVTLLFAKHPADKIQYLFHLVPVGKVDSAITIEFSADDYTSDTYVLLLAFEKVPTYRSFEFAQNVDITGRNASLDGVFAWKTDEQICSWFLDNNFVKNRTGRWILTVMSLTRFLNPDELSKRSFDKALATSFKQSYTLRTISAGCYFFEPSQQAWIANGVKVDESQYGLSVCRTSHLTSFAMGVFVLPNTIDFNYVFAAASFSDNLTIYFTVIFCLILYLIILFWARIEDKKDKERLVSHSFPDNRSSDKYIYEILTFTGNWPSATCDSKIFLLLSGDDDVSGVRVMDNGRKDTLRKGTVDSYIMKTKRPLGSLNYLRVWHDNTGWENYASWFVTAIIVRDVQTEEKFEFIINNWLAVDKGDGEIDRTVQVAGATQKSDIPYLFQYTTGRNIKDNHLWFSIFLRSPRSRFTRCQRVSTAFALLFLSMLANAMWYGTVAETVTDTGLGFGLVTLTPQQVWIGFMSSLITLPPSLLIMFIFRKSRIRKLRPSRIDEALKEKKSQNPEEIQAQNETLGNDSGHESGIDDQPPQKEEDPAKEKETPADGKKDSDESDDNDSSDDESDDDSDASEKSKKTSKSKKSAKSTKSSKSAKSAKSTKSKKSTTEGEKTAEEKKDSDDSDDSDDSSDSDEDSDESEKSKKTTKSKKSTKSNKSLKSVKSSKNEPEITSAVEQDVKIEVEKHYDEEKALEQKIPKRFGFPWFCVFVGWFLCLSTILVSIFFLWSFGVMFGNDLTYQWLTSLLVSFFAGILVIEPIKVVLIAALFAICCRNFDLNEDDDMEDDEYDPISVDDTEDWPPASGDKSREGLNAIDEARLGMIRQKRLTELNNWEITKEISSYFVFICVVLVITVGDRDTTYFELKNSINSNFITKNALNQDIMKWNRFDQMSTTSDWWDWAQTTIVNQLRVASLYNGQPPYGLRGYIGDTQNRIMGYAILRQIRVKPNTCKVHPSFHSMTRVCALNSGIVNEDSQDFCDGWFEETELTHDLPSCQREEFKYKTAEELQSLPFSATLDSYSGGGYVYRIRGSAKNIQNDLEDLRRLYWVDNNTRAVFLEFSTYNANTNLFAICSMVAESIPGGGIVPYWFINPVRLIHSSGVWGNFLYFCEFAFAIFIIYFICKELLQIKRGGFEYLKSYWNLAEMVIIIAAIAAIGCYIYRYFLVRDILSIFSQTKGNGYVNLQYIGLIDSYYTQITSLILFVGILKFIKLLRFNNRFAVLILTLKVAWEDLTGFFAVFFLVFFAFVQLFYMILHTNLLQFYTVFESLATCFTMLLGKFDFTVIQAQSTTAAIMFFIFAMSCTFILINVLLTIIIEAFEKVQEDLADKENEFEIMDFLKYNFNASVGFERAPPPLSATERDESEDAEEELENEQEENANVASLPQKVDAFLRYINDLYFEGQMDPESKDLFAKDFGEKEKGEKVIFNSEDSTGKAVRNRRQKPVFVSE